MQPVDIVIAWTAVHGGSYHKLFHLQDKLREAGLSCRIFLSSEPPLGLQPGIDLSEAQIEELAGRDVLVLTLKAMEERLRADPARLFLFPCGKEPHLSEWSGIVKRVHGARTGQLGYLFDDYHYWHTDHVFMQMPATLWFAMEYYDRHSCRELGRARSISFCGNIFYEAVTNRWTSEVADRDSFFGKYGLDPERPLLLWMPSRGDGENPVYGNVIRAAEALGMNLVVKLHPWEYKNIQHGFDPRYGAGKTSADAWNVPAIQERDSSWAQAFCDLAVVSGSTVGIEMAWWKKPVVYIDAWHWCPEVLAACCVNTRDGKGLDAYLKRRWPFAYTDADYASARALMHPEPSRDAFDLHVDAIRAALDMPEDAPAIGGLGQVRALYKGRVPSVYLRGNTRLGRVLGRAKDFMTGKKRQWK